jgi:hypothetical protein
VLAARLGVCVALVTAGCSLGSDEDRSATRPELASGAPLPASCVARPARPAATVTFVANGRAWALEPSGGRLTCLFPARHPGPFAWGPRGDRALLARLEVKGLAGAPTRPPTTVDPEFASWGRPIGKSIVFVGRDGRALLKAHPAGGGFQDVTPIAGVRYERVVYHPSGLAFAFVVKRGTKQSLWISSNVGATPRKLVHGLLHTGFDALAFARAGQALYFAARHKGGYTDVHTLELVGANSAPVLWRGAPEERVTDLAPGLRSDRAVADVAFTVGRSCETRRAVVLTARHAKGADIHLDDRPTSVVGWLDANRLLVAVGGCGETSDLYTVSKDSLAPRLLVRGVTTAAVRRPELSPPPPLPREVLRQQSAPA